MHGTTPDEVGASEHDFSPKSLCNSECRISRCGSHFSPINVTHAEEKLDWAPEKCNCMGYLPYWTPQVPRSWLKKAVHFSADRDWDTDDWGRLLRKNEITSSLPSTVHPAKIVTVTATVGASKRRPGPWEKAERHRDKRI